jgi:hypothetical protein
VLFSGYLIGMRDAGKRSAVHEENSGGVIMGKIANLAQS